MCRTGFRWHHWGGRQMAFKTDPRTQSNISRSCRKNRRVRNTRSTWWRGKDRKDSKKKVCCGVSFQLMIADGLMMVHKCSMFIILSDNPWIFKESLEWTQCNLKVGQDQCFMLLPARLMPTGHVINTTRTATVKSPRFIIMSLKKSSNSSKFIEAGIDPTSTSPAFAILHKRSRRRKVRFIPWRPNLSADYDNKSESDIAWHCCNSAVTSWGMAALICSNKPQYLGNLGE